MRERERGRGGTGGDNATIAATARTRSRSNSKDTTTKAQNRRSYFSRTGSVAEREKGGDDESGWVTSSDLNSRGGSNGVAGVSRDGGRRRSSSSHRPDTALSYGSRGNGSISKGAGGHGGSGNGVNSLNSGIGSVKKRLSLLKLGKKGSKGTLLMGGLREED